jgi:hypothetical protein
MKHRLAVLMLFTIMSLAGCTMWREHQVSDFKDATGGEGLERSFWKQVKAKRWNALEGHLAGNYVLVTPEAGRLDRPAALARFRQIQLDEYTLGDLQTEMNTETLVVTYAITMRGTLAGQPLPTDPVRMMTVWQKQKAGWMEIAHSVLGPQKK